VFAGFAARRQTEGRQVSTINSSLRVLRRVLRMAVEWGALGSAPKIRFLPGGAPSGARGKSARGSKVFLCCNEPLSSIAVVLVDTGSRRTEHKTLLDSSRETSPTLGSRGEMLHLTAPVCHRESAHGLSELTGREVLLTLANKC
jgi:hypothetical protein